MGYTLGVFTGGEKGRRIERAGCDVVTGVQVTLFGGGAGGLWVLGNNG